MIRVVSSAMWPTCEDNSPALILERSELQKLIQEGLEKLPGPERIVLDLYYRQGQNIREIAPILDVHITRISQIKAQAVHPPA